VLGLVEDGQCDLGEIDQRHVEAAMLDGDIEEPLRDGRTDPPRAGAAEDNVKLGQEGSPSGSGKRSRPHRMNGPRGECRADGSNYLGLPLL
jgi:hypothetical protein